MDTEMWKTNVRNRLFSNNVVWNCNSNLVQNADSTRAMIVRKGLISRIPSEFRRAIGSRGKICVFLTIGSFGPRFRWPSAHSKD